MMMPRYYFFRLFDIAFGIDFVDLFWLSIGFSFVLWLIILRVKTARLKAIFAGFALLFVTSIFVLRSALVEQQTWLIIDASIKTSNGAPRAQKIADLKEKWFYGGMTMYDWYVLSSRWNICHEMGVKERANCVKQSGVVAVFASGKYSLDDFVSGEAK